MVSVNGLETKRLYHQTTKCKRMLFNFIFSQYPGIFGSQRPHYQEVIRQMLGQCMQAKETENVSGCVITNYATVYRGCQTLLADCPVSRLGFSWSTNDSLSTTKTSFGACVTISHFQRRCRF